MDEEKFRKIERMSAQLMDWLHNGVPTACKQPPWQHLIDRKDAEKVKSILDGRRK